jgi:xanthine dehydrogenase iron-sulfur cluster and FAD-binding subunit A
VTLGPGGQRTVLLDEFYRLPGDTPHIATVLEPGEVVTAIMVPGNPSARRSHYLKVRDRGSFDFALVSAAVALDMNGEVLPSGGGVGFCSGASSSCAARDGEGSDDGCKLSVRLASLRPGGTADSEGGAEPVTRSTG